MLDLDAAVEARAESMSLDDITRAPGRDDIFPMAAMTAAGAQREATAPVFASLVTRLGALPMSEVTDADLFALLPVVHLLAEWRETSACPF